MSNKAINANTDEMQMLHQAAWSRLQEWTDAIGFKKFPGVGVFEAYYSEADRAIHLKAGSQDMKIATDMFLRWAIKKGIPKKDLTSTDYLRFVAEKIYQARRDEIIFIERLN